VAAPLEDDDEHHYLQEGAAAAVKAAENLSRGLSQNVQWGMDAAADHMHILHRKRGVPRAADPTKASSKAAQDTTASNPTPPRGIVIPISPKVGVSPPKPSPLCSPPPSPPAAAAPAATESPATRSILRRSSSSVSSEAGPSLSQSEHQSPVVGFSDARATASAPTTKRQVVTTPYYTLTTPLIPSSYPFTATSLPTYCPLTAPLLPSPYHSLPHPYHTLTTPLPHPYHTLTIPITILYHTLTKVVLLVRWTPMIGSLLRALDARMPSGSTLYVLSERKEKVRAQDINPNSLTLTLTATLNLI